MILQYLFDHWDRVLSLTGEHLQLAAISLAAALLVALPLGVLAARFERLRLPAFGVLDAVYTIPSLALLAFLIPVFGLGRVPAVIALAAYSQLFLVRNVVAGLRGVDPAVLETARGMGMTQWQLLRQVQLPLALPVVLAGIRVALVTTISLTTITAWINAGGLGLLLFDGITRDNPPQIVAGALAVTALAVLADQLMRALERLTAASRAMQAAKR